MKLVVIFLFLVAAGSVQATEKLWMPMGEPEGSMVPVIQATPDKQGNSVPIPQPTPGSTETPVIGTMVKDGHWAYHYPDKTTESEGNYSLGVKDGIWKYYLPNGQESREMEYKDGQFTGSVVLWAADGSQKYYGNLTDLVQKAVPTDFQVKTLLPYWIDLLGDGDHELLVLARSDKSSLIIVFDGDGHLLDSRVFSGFAEDFVFGEIRKGGPVCFGYDVACDKALGVCQWEFDTWDGSKIKTVLQYQGWYSGKSPFVMPVFNEDGDQVVIKTDNGIFKWDDSQGAFEKTAN